MKVCLGADVYGYPEGGGHLWEYLNWALGFRSAGCEVLWLERVPADSRPEDVRANASMLKERLAPYGLGDSLVLASSGEEQLAPGVLDGCRGVDDADRVDLFLNLGYGRPVELPGCRRTALLDIDPGLVQLWVSRGWMEIDGYDAYFTVGETVGRTDARFPDLGLDWQYTPSCVALDWWRPADSEPDAAFTTVSNWDTYDEWMEDDAGEWYSNDKKAGFEPFLDLPARTSQPLELALCLGDDAPDEAAALAAAGWRVRHAEAVAGTPEAYRDYIASSRGEFSCVKPSCVRLENAWISNRTLCYLASGKPAVVQHTGASDLLPDRAGLFRFRTLDEAAESLEAAASDYERQSAFARALVEEHFDARKVAARVLERAAG